MKKISRRKILKAGAAATTLLGVGCSLKATRPGSNEERNRATDWKLSEKNRFQYIIIGSGAGGGPLAARLAREGFEVLLIEAGSANVGSFSPIPAFHGRATDDPQINWSFFVKRYMNPSTDRRNTKYNEIHQGIYYPRASAVGGCTTVNAMVHLYPDHQDWNDIAERTGDASWNSEKMYKHYQDMLFDPQKEQQRLANNFQNNISNGWLQLSQTSPKLLLEDPVLLEHVLSVFKKEGLLDEAYQKIVEEDFNIKLNPNIRAYLEKKYDGAYNIPINSVGGRRKGVRELLLRTREQYPNLKIMTETHCRRLLFDPQNSKKVIGVELAEGEKVYKAFMRPQDSFKVSQAFATHEVIVAGGAFNSPQLLMLSGIGRRDQLQQHGIPVRAEVPGVGLNLQDRYEVTVISKLKHPFSLTAQCNFGLEEDNCFNDYLENPSSHLYATNGIVISLIQKSYGFKKTPDLAIFGVPGYFKGYYPKWSQMAYNGNYFSWTILKGHTRNIDGYVNLKSADFRDQPDICFKYFNDNQQDPTREDLLSIAKGVQTARELNSGMTKIIEQEVYPGPNVKTEKQVQQFIKDEAWGHHASCSNKMGNLQKDPMAVVDSEFRVRGVEGLRIVDASIFPRIPGLFIMLPTLIVSEKAADLLIQQHRRS